MDYRKEFKRMMETQTEIAIATSVDGLPMSALSIFIMMQRKKRCTSQALRTIIK